MGCSFALNDPQPRTIDVQLKERECIERQALGRGSGAPL
jgi:hypothetical protein